MYNGLSEVFEKSIIHPISKIITKRIDFYSKRDPMKVDNTIRPNGLSIKFKESLNTEELIELKKQLEEGTSFSVAVFHAGNPYFEANLIDRKEGTSYYISATGDKMTISPLSAVSPASFITAVECIQSTLREGEVRGYRDDRREPSIRLNS